MLISNALHDRGDQDMAITAQTSDRIQSIDILRGLVIVIMALDHTRDFFHISNINPTDPATTNGLLFFTRWITHYCAPAFLFLAGLSAFLHATRAGLTRNQLARFLALRGLWLIVVELVIINFAWQFDYGFLLVQVIWAIGASMIALAVLIYLPPMAILIISVGMIIGHNLLDPVTPETFWGPDWIWKIAHEGGYTPFNLDFGPSGLFVAYPLIPWIGVMSLGYAAGRLFEKSASARNKQLLFIGIGATVAFIALRAINIYGDPAPWQLQERGAFFTLLSFLDTTKYPPSLLFLLMTLGPALAIMPVLERAKGALVDFFTTFGRVPFFFYIVHFFLIHILAVVWFGLTAGAWNYDVYTAATFPDVEPSLLRVYIATIIIVALLYWPCRWFSAYKVRHRDWSWLSYF